MRTPSALVFLSAALFGCDSSSPPSAAVTVSQAAAIVPTDQRLATLYTQSCKSCHSIPGGVAPLVQDRSQWDARWTKGLPTLLQSTINGLNGMPPGGQCFSCSAQDYEALIKFMAGQE
jgi:cytochrome c5